MIYGKYAQEYFEKGLIPVPIINGEKRPALNEWTTLETYKDSDLLIEKYKNCGIGLLTGKDSGIIVVDIDLTDNKMKETIAALLPKPLVGKIGNKNKGVNIFFQYNGERSEKFYYKGKTAVEILSNRCQTVLPPTVHPDLKYPYEWVNNSLLDIDVDNLPILGEYFIDWCYANLESKSDKVKDSGRNNSLSQQASAAIFTGKDPTTIIKELVEYDSLKHTTPLFSDHTEPGMRDQTPLSNATKFYFSVFKSIHRSKESIPSWNDSRIEIIDSHVPSNDYKSFKLPKLRGIAQDLFQYIYNQAPVQRTRLAYASTISLMATLLSNKIRHQNIHTNLYSMILAPSGYGKDAYLKFPTKVLAKAKLEHLVGIGIPSSDSAVLKGLTAQPARIDTMDEMSRLFLAMKDSKTSWQAGIQDVYAELFSSAGDSFLGKTLATADKPYGKCFSPCVSVLGAMTVKDFKTTFDQNMMDKGIGGRFLYFIDEEPKMSIGKPFAPVPDKIIKDILRYFSEKKPIMSENELAPQINIPPAAYKYLQEINIEINKKKMAADDTVKIKPFLNRIFEQFIKLAMIDAASTNFDGSFSRLQLKKDNLEWAYNSVTQLTKTIENFLDKNLNNSEIDMIQNELEMAIESKGEKGLTLTDLGNLACVKSMGKGLGIRKRDEALTLLEQYGKIIKTEIKTNPNARKGTRIYYSTKYVREV